MTPEEIEKLIQSRNGRERFLATTVANLTKDQLFRLATDDDLAVRTAALKNDKIDSEILGKIYKTGTYYRFEIALDHRLTKEMIQDLVEDPQWEVRQLVAERPDLTQQQIGRLMADPHISVRMSLAHNPILLPQHIDVMIENDENTILMILTRHKNTTIDQLIRLGSNEEECVRDAALERL